MMKNILVKMQVIANSLGLRGSEVKVCRDTVKYAFCRT